jgi:hypothetical protein
MAGRPCETAPLFAGHQRKIVAQAMMLCNAAMSTLLPQSSQMNHGASVSSKGEPSKDEALATLTHYSKQLPQVRMADDAMSKDVLALLFQLVQVQIRKAEKFREVRVCPDPAAQVRQRTLGSARAQR